MELNSELDRLAPLERYLVVERELNLAKEIHPKYPTDMFQQLAIIGEELGEANKAVLDYHSVGAEREPVKKSPNDKGGSGSDKVKLEHIKHELIQTAAMCMRMLDQIDIKLKEKEIKKSIDKMEKDLQKLREVKK